MTPSIEDVQVLEEEGQVVMKVTIPVNFSADSPIGHLDNEKQIREATRQAGLEATRAVYQRIADRSIATRSYPNQDGYSMRQDEVSKVEYVCGYGGFEIRRPNFVNDYTGAGEVPFETETRMDEHRMTPMFQFICLQGCVRHGPQEVARLLEEDLRLGVSHHLLDQFLETMGGRYRSVRPEALRDAIEADWTPSWLPPIVRAGKDASTPEESLVVGSVPEERTEEIRLLQYDLMTVTIRKYEGDPDKGTRGRKYHTERHQLHNVVLGGLLLDGPRTAGEPIDLRERRYFSEYFSPEDLLVLARQNLEASGLPLGEKLLLQADGAEKLWERMEAVFSGYDLVEILDERHCQKNLRKAADLAHPEEDQRNRAWVEKRMDELYTGRYEHFFNALNYLVRRADDPKVKEQLQTRRTYFRNNQHRILYHDFLKEGYIISTCFVESGHRHVIGARLRGNGRSYVEERLGNIADLRCEYKSHRLPRVFEIYLMERHSEAA